MTIYKTDNNSVLRSGAGILAVLAVVYCTYFAIAYSGQRLLDSYSFRETQTAITAVWACHDGIRLRYETPIGGLPWSIPFEFPLYQWLVAGISCSAGFDLERTGRLVSFVFLLLCIFPVARIGRSLFGRHGTLATFVFLAIFFTTPLYVFYGRSFLMETVALFFSLYFVSYSISLIQGDRSIRVALLAALMLTLAILQKSTTVLPLIPVFGFWLLVKALPEIRAKGVRARVLWLGIGAYFIPFVVGAAWAKYTDFVKEYSAIGHRLTSGALFVWNFGTLQGRFSAHMWHDVIWQRDLVQNVGGVLGIVIFVVGLIRLRGVYRYSVAAAALLFLLYFFVFQNLHTVHEYYQMANLIFAVAAVSIALAGLMQDQNTAIRVGAVLATVAMVVVNVHSFLTGFHYQEIRQSFDNDPVIQVSNVIRSSTDPGKPIIVFGDDWNSEIPFFSQRKGFVVPGFVRNHEDIVEHPEKYVGMRPSVIAICRDVRGSTFEQTVERVSKPTRIERTDVCDLLFM